MESGKNKTHLQPLKVMIYLSNSLPNSFYALKERKVEITGITAYEAVKLLKVSTVETDPADVYESADVVGVRLGYRVESVVGHESTAQLFSARLGDASDITNNNGDIVPLTVPVNRVTVDCSSLPVGTVWIAGLFSSPRRLAEGERWTEEEILSTPIQWVKARIVA